MVGVVQGLLASYGTVAAPAPSLFRCTSFQISIGCCTGTGQCGELGAGVSCSPANGFFDPDAC
jgi:hypothetical protein